MDRAWRRRVARLRENHRRGCGRERPPPAVRRPRRPSPSVRRPPPSRDGSGSRGLSDLVNLASSHAFV